MTKGKWYATSDMKQNTIFFEKLQKQSSKIHSPDAGILCTEQTDKQR
jgi:hypothetical protein